MSFFCIASFDYSKDEVFSHKIQVIHLKDASQTEVYVNLRTFEKGRPTDNGICLLKAEFEKVLPFLEKKESTTIRNGRTLKFLKVETNFYELLLIKPNHDFQVMILTDKEITDIVALKEKVLDGCKVWIPRIPQWAIE